MLVFVVDDDIVIAECIAKACAEDVRIFSNGIDAIKAIDELGIPDLMFLDVLLDGPDGFTLLNELVSYADTAMIPIVIVSSLDLTGQDLSMYGVVGVLDKALMTPREVREYVKKYSK